MRGLDGKRILVAGAATGIGAATAARLASEGAKLYLGDINEEGVRAVASSLSAGVARFDLADAASVQALVAASWAGEAVRPAYAASKAGINTLTRHVASAYGKDGVRCNSVSPGAVLSETALATMSEEFKAAMLASVKVPRLGRPDDLAATICFLLSDDTTWVSGQVWTVNGGAGFRD